MLKEQLKGYFNLIFIISSTTPPSTYVKLCSLVQKIQTKRSTGYDTLWWWFPWPSHISVQQTHSPDWKLIVVLENHWIQFFFFLKTPDGIVESERVNGTVEGEGEGGHVPGPLRSGGTAWRRALLLVLYYITLVDKRIRHPLKSLKLNDRDSGANRAP